MRTLSAILPTLFLGACKGSDSKTTPSSDPPATVLRLSSGALQLNDDGSVDLLDRDHRLVVDNAVAVAVLNAADGTGTELRTDDDRHREVFFGAERLWLRRIGEEGEPDLLWSFTLLEDDVLAVGLEVQNHTSAPVSIAKLAPFRVDDGGLFVGADPTRHRILENGSHASIDFVVEVRPGDTLPDEAAAVIAPGHYAGHSVSDWNHAVADLDSDAVWIAGALSFDRSMPVANLTYTESAAPIDDHGRAGFHYLSLEADLLPHPIEVAPGDAFAAESWALLPFEDDVLTGLEHYAEVLAEALGVVPWHRRSPERRVPNGWNSWSGSGGTGGYGTDVNEALILENAAWTARELRDWGITWFQLDDGYEPFYGDWEWREDRFPSGPRGLSDAIRALGLTPGLWMAPFTADPNSAIVAEHPDWFAEKTVLGRVVSSDYEILDLTHPQVQDYLAELARTVHEDWGYDWYKLDFGYHALFADSFTVPNTTREEAWREGLQILRDNLGEDTFFVLVGLVGITYDRVDSARVTLDNSPSWDQQPGVSDDNHLEQQGIKPTLRTAGRRWYLQDRVWVNHPDLIIFRSNTRDETWPRVSFEEARSFATWVGLSGGIVKLGDRLVEMKGEEVDVIRRLVPAYGVAARPLDVLEREFPEVWQLEVDAPLDGDIGQWQVLGLFDWGRNSDLTTEPYTPIEDPEVGRTHTIPLSELGLQGPVLAWEFWTESFVGRIEDSLTVDVPSHDSRVVALRTDTGEPQFLGWNRELRMGATVLEAAVWDASTGALEVRFEAVPGTELAPFEYTVAVWIPDDFTPGDTTLSSGDAFTVDDAAVDGGTVRTVRFEATSMGTVELVVEASP